MTNRLFLLVVFVFGAASCSEAAEPSLASDDDPVTLQSDAAVETVSQALGSGFGSTEMSYAIRSTRANHSNASIAIAPWMVHTVVCPFHANHVLRTNVWSFSDYQDWQSNGRSARLALSALDLSDPRDQELKLAFDQSRDIVVRVQFSQTGRVQDLVVRLRP